MAHVNILILSAITSEAAPCVAVVESYLRDLDLDIAPSILYRELGVGPLDSLTTAHALPSADLVIYVGSCGEFIHHHQPQQLKVRLCTANQFYWSPTASRSFAGRLITSSAHHRSLTNLHPCLSKLECLPNFTSSTLTLDPQLVPAELTSSTHLSSHFSTHLSSHPGTENMELFAMIPYLSTAKQVVLILGITNLVGGSGHHDWQLNRTAVAQMSAQFLSRHLTSIITPYLAQ